MKKSQHSVFRHLPVIAWSLLAIALSVGAGQSVLALESFYASHFAPGVFIGREDVSNRTLDDVRAVLSDFQASLQENGITATYQSRKAVLYPSAVLFDSDIPFDAAQPLADIDIEKTLASAFAVGHRENPFSSSVERIRGFFKKTVVTPTIIVDADALKTAFEKEFSSSLAAAVDPKFTYDPPQGSIVVVPGIQGVSFSADRIGNDVSLALTRLEIPSLSLTLETDMPNRSEETLRTLLPHADELLRRSPNAFSSDAQSFALDPAVKTAWLLPSSDGTSVVFDEAAVRAYLARTVEPLIRVTPESPHFTLENGRVRALTGPVTGKSLDTDAAVFAFVHATTTDPVQLVIRDVALPLSDTLSDIQIKEMVAQAETDFKGSPSNRKKNIALGMSRINGLLVMPDEEFSLIKALGPIEVSNGFLPELVIKGAKTIPEAGGGLCQVSTTLFRAVAKAGLPILERRNHSYRVSYYEPPVGFDATVYFPKPDFRFKNDTANPILVFASVHGTKARVSLWGTKDGRTVEIDAPTVSNIKKPGAIKMIETADLPPGKKKCTERAHNGADAIFDRRVTLANGELKTDTFKSHYVVWPAVCLVGKNPDVASAIESSSTPQTVSEQASTSTATASE
ncbi:VanW family protein [Candidatus Uhrbacteria bacterium]|nr:VanW family protein [Candidatus Uhrbacteria bacterium]